MLFNKKIIYSLITFSFISIFIFSCRSMGNSVVVVDDIISTNRIVAIASFTFPKSMTNVNIDRLKYLNTEIYTDVVKFQQKHADELYIIVDEAISNGVYTLKNKVPYAFSTNDILFTQKTFSLTNEEYAKKAGIK